MFWYFGYGSNMDLRSLRARGVEPRASERAVLRGWRLRFNVRHFFLHEGGVGNIEPTEDASDSVWGVLHCCEDDHLALLDAAEAYGHGYDRINISVIAEYGERRAIAYVGIASFLDDGCLPTQRYLNILVLDPAYIDALRRHRVHRPSSVPSFVPPSGEYPVFTLLQHPLLTALAGAVFDMSGARWELKFLYELFGGKDMTLFLLKRLDDSEGNETLEDIKHGRLTSTQRGYLNEYLHQYASEYVYAGRYAYD
jgi:hypothetical protein